MPGYGTILPLARAISCHCQARNNTSGGRKRSNKKKEEKQQGRSREKLREKDYSRFYPSPFTKSPETPINTGVPRGEEWRTTLHHSSPTLHLDIFSSDYAELTEHSCSTDYAQIRQASVFRQASQRICNCLPSGVPADLQSAVKKRSTYETGGFAIPPQSINS